MSNQKCNHAISYRNERGNLVTYLAASAQDCPHCLGVELAALRAETAAKVQQAVREIEEEARDYEVPPMDQYDAGFSNGARRSVRIVRRIFETPAKG